ncbi:2-hydroxyglutaryl-CoA dehydratase [Soehngenia longivitae]|uniref:2-hydroxyglutaryl-CoA dehydratase n=1 Tax=Soehngenia longivitae TaxID=2562294 RepID=A0A4Z0DA10_9FIRM|nr:acyl-CoA dehydratase activase-related protein [Soehngenia longivitae]TFZ41748.1 2-hydroxyglutaryl-CoA dehydratase [Soehngenia longivitae]
MKIGIDVGSTTLKCVVLDESNNMIFHSYERHFSQINEKTIELLEKLKEEFPNLNRASIAISGSAGMGLAQRLKIPFIQEVYATRLAVMKEIEDPDVVIELGGEDAKILFLSNGMEVRMNGSCAGGTGAFIDQMATLMGITLTQMNDLARTYNKIYTIASRCGVFAKSDIQPLLNQGASKNDISCSIFQAVVNQTIGGLAQGRPIKGKVVYLGGPLTFFSELRKRFDDTLGLIGICPENSLYFVALGAAHSAESTMITIDELIYRIKNSGAITRTQNAKRLFDSEDEYIKFKDRHDRDTVNFTDPSTYSKGAYLGIDAGSTTIKACIIAEDETILGSMYSQNEGNPVPILREFLIDFMTKYPQIEILGSAVTGYGEELIKNAFSIDLGIVETIAHYTAAKKYKPDVDFIIDIGGQDIKCFKIKDGLIDNIFLNEACSSGCGSFLQTFAQALGYDIADFARLGIYAKNPVDLGSRCTVFMNSSVKQAQKDGATISDISAGLSISVIKNALYKVIRASNADDLGENIVVQGGTFYNDSVLKAFEDELGKNVIRPNIAGLMGAYGASLYAKHNLKDKTTTINREGLLNFEHKVKSVICGLCENNCTLTINTFGDNRKFIGGNRCERPIKGRTKEEKYNMYDEKKKLLQSYKPIPGKRGKIGIPLALNNYELLPFWHTVFTMLGFEVVSSPFSSRELYTNGQHTIPSDTVCFPAKLVHGHIEYLLDEGIEVIFYPCLTYNFDEKKGDNHFNCPVVAYYPEVIAANVERTNHIVLINDYLGLHNKQSLIKGLYKALNKHFDDINLQQIRFAVECGMREYKIYQGKIRKKGEELLNLSKKLNKRAIVLAGRPYHLDPEVNHGIDKLLTELGVIVLSEDSIAHLGKKIETNVLNQWTYHSRLYTTAKLISNYDNVELIQLVSFGCGLDAITSDEVKEILEENGKIYTQIKIDEITNLGAVKIRVRSLLAALEQREKEGGQVEQKIR